MITEPSHSIEAEQATLGCIMLRPEAYHELAAIGITETSFWRPANAAIWAAAGRCIDTVGEADPITMSEQLEADRAKTGGPPVDREYLLTLMDAVPSASHAEHYGRILLEHQGWRVLQSLPADIQQALARKIPVADAIADIQQALRELENPQHAPSYSGIETAQEVVDGLARRQDGEEPDLLHTGLDSLDCILTGIEPEQLIILGGAASSGKTAFALQLTDKWTREGVSVGWLSLEMSRHKLLRRILADNAGVSIGIFKATRPNDRQLDAIADAAGHSSLYNLVIDDRSDVTENNVTARARMLAARHGCRVIVVDHLHIISSGRSDEGIRHSVDRITKGLKLLAKDQGLRIILISQLSRKGEYKESQGIDANGDINMKIVRDVAANQADTQFEVVKDRDGACGRCDLYYYPYRFHNEPRTRRVI